MRALPLLLCFGLLGCDEAEPRLAVTVCGDVVAIDAVRLVLRDEDGRERQTGVAELPRAPDAAVVDAAVVDAAVSDAAVDDAGAAGLAPCAPLAVAASLPRPRGVGWLRAIGLREGVEVVRGEVRVEGGAARVVLRAACAGVLCRDGQTCDAEGACAPVPLDPGPCPATCGG